ncbi:MAG: DUF488 family protein [Planctomycetes bacterium]|nr:DUF488 family protein [Planctomycetota bacterium]
MPVLTKSLKDPAAPADGVRVLIARFRPRGVRKDAETWAAWDKRLAPSQALFDALNGRRREGGRVVARGLPPLGWEAFRARFLGEMRAAPAEVALAEWAARAAAETVTLLCHCARPAQCHRALVQALLRARGHRGLH